MPPIFDSWRACVVAAEVSMATNAAASSLAAMRSQRLAELLAAAAAHSPRYRRLLAGCDPATARLEELPVARKAELMGDFAGWVCDPALSLPALRRFLAEPANIAADCLGPYTAWESSGSTGEPAIFVQDARAMAVYDALEALRRPLLRPFERLLDPWSLGERIAFLGATGGETLSAAGRAFLKEAFACPVANSYGASEFLSLAFECSLGVLHLNSDWAILEPVDAQGRAVPAGHAGTTTLLTNLANHLQPVIRYDLGDRVRLLDAPCGCGSHLPVIEVHGRDDDTLCLAAGVGMPPVRVVPLAVSTVLEEEAGLFDFQLVQQGPRELLLKTRGQGQKMQRTLRKARAALAAFLETQGAKGVRIECRAGESTQCGRSGKFRRVISLNAKPDDAC